MEKIKHYKSSKGMVYKRIVDDFIMGNELYLGEFIDGTEDVIENYVEVADEVSVNDMWEQDVMKSFDIIGYKKLIEK